jgi:hypothetical protein
VQKLYNETRFLKYVDYGRCVDLLTLTSGDIAFVLCIGNYDGYPESKDTKAIKIFKNIY